MLYLTIYIEPRAEPIGLEMLELPEIRKYISDSGKVVTLPHSLSSS